MIRKISLIIVSMIMYIWVLYWFMEIDIQEWIRQTYDEFKSSDFYDHLDSSKTFWNLYSVAYDSIDTINFSSDKETFDFMSEDLISRSWEWWSCDVSSEDMLNVYRDTLWGSMIERQLINNWWSISTFENDAENFVKDSVDSCVKVAKCIIWESSMESDSLYDNENMYSIDTYNICKNTVVGYYEINKWNILKNNELKISNYWDDMFLNWDIDDSPYDLLYDIEQIWNILFSNNKEAPKTYLYWNWSWGWWWWEEVGVDIDLIEDIAESMWIIWDWEEEDEYVVWPDEDVDDIIEEIIWNVGEDDWYISWWDIEENNVNWNDSIINWMCIDSEIDLWDSWTDWWSDDIDEVLGWIWLNPDTYIDDELIDEDNAINTMDEFNDDEFQTILDDFRESLFWNPSAEEINNQLNSCMDDCWDLWPFDQIVCKAQCLCQATTSMDWIVSVKFCLVPTRKKPVEWTKEVLSIEEMVDEVLNVTTNLKESWELFPHKFTDERMETALQDIKLSRILAFDFVIIEKPIFSNTDKKQEREQREKEETEYNKDKERQILWNYWDIVLREERNKYVNSLWFNSEAYRATQRPANTLEERDNNIDLATRYSEQKYTNTDDAAEDEQENYHRESMDRVRNFILDNIKFWWALTDSLYDLNNNSRAFRKKIEATTN